MSVSKMKQKRNWTRTPVVPTSSLTEGIGKYLILESLRDKKNLANRLMCELRMSLFIEAALDPKRENCLQPFPPCFVDSKTKEKNFPGLMKEIEKIPSLQTFDDSTQLPDQTWELLNWIFTTPFTIEPLVTQTTQIQNEMTKLKQTTGLKNLPIPNNIDVFIFSVTSTEPKKAFAEAKMKYGSQFTFYGSPVRGFHSILNRGLLFSIKAIGCDGSEGWMTSIINESYIDAVRGQGWKHGLFGNHKCIAVVEAVMPPDPKLQLYVCDTDDHIQLTHLIIYR